MSSEPKVSIGIPSYNHAHFLPAAIESVLAQTYKNIEIIIVDDGSTDGSLAIAEDYASGYPGVVRVFTHPGHANRGISATVNLYWEKSTGTYVSGLASDDQYHPLKIAEQVAFLERHPELGWVYGYAVCVDEHDKPLPEFGLIGVNVTRVPDPVERLILSNAVNGMTVLLRRAAGAEIEHDEALVYSDWDFWVRLAARHKMGFLPRARVRYRIHSSNTSLGISAATNLGYNLEVMKKLRREADRLGGLLARPRTKALLDLQGCFCSYGMQEQESGGRYLAAAFETDATLWQDARYFCRWIRHCQRIFRGMSPPELSANYTPWVLEHLPAGADQEFVRAVRLRVTGGIFASAHDYLDRAKGYWEHRRSLVDSLFHDGRIWRDRELFASHAQSLSAAVRGDLRRLLRRSRSSRLRRREIGRAPL